MVLHVLPLAEAVVEAGGYVSPWKIAVMLVVLLAWMRVLTWIDKDTLVAYLPREIINSAFIGGAVLAVMAFFILPGFWICLAVLIGVFIAEVATYLILRQQKVGLADLKTELGKMFAGKAKKAKEHQAIEGEVALIDKRGSVVTPPEAESPDAPSFMAAQQLLTDPMSRGAERIDLTLAEGAAQVKYQVDGFPYNATSMDVAASQGAVAYLKRLAGMDLNERRKPQKGKMKVAVGATRHELELQTAGTTAGESLRIMVDPKKRHALRLGELGMSEDQLAKVREMIADSQGVVIIAAPKGQGLTTVNYGIIREHDAFLTHIHTIERAPEDDLEGITQNAIAAAATPDEEFKQVDWVCSQEPDVVMLTLLESPKSAQSLIRFAEGGKRAYVGMRAGSTFQALDTWRKLVGNDALALKNLRMVIAGRVLRRLCNACKVAYTPDPDTVRKLNLDPARVSTLYQARTQPMRDAKGNPVNCGFCKELRYKGRVGVYEILQVDDDLRNIIASGGSVNQLRALFRKQRARFLQEMALAQISEGETSVQEMLRVLRSDQGPSAPPAAAGAGQAAPSSPRAPARPPAR